MRSAKVSCTATVGVQQGVGFVEILVAIVLLSIGVMAGARMQISGMRFSQSAYFQSQASLMASDIVDRMRANIDGVQAGLYDNFSASPSASDQSCGTQLCTPKQLADQDQYDWSKYLFSLSGSSDKPDKTFVALLPGTKAQPASASVSRVSNAGGTFDEGRFKVEVTWVEEINSESEQQTLRVDFVTEY